MLPLQDELSHINARLNMGILGCKYLPVCAPFFKILFLFIVLHVSQIKTFDKQLQRPGT